MTDAEINACLVKHWEGYGAPRDEGDFVARVRMSLTRSVKLLTEVQNALYAGDIDGIEKALVKLDKLDPEHPGTTIGDVIEDVVDICDAVARYGKRKKGRAA